MATTAAAFLAKIIFITVIISLFNYNSAESTITKDPLLKYVEKIVPYNFENNVLRRGEFANSKSEPNSTERCLQDLLHVLGSLKKNATGWAGQMLDATGKPPAGILRGAVKWMGNYRECLSVTVPEETNNVTNITEGGFNGKFCWVNFKVMPPLGLSSALCVPSSCSDEIFNELKYEISEFIEKFIPSALNYSESFTFSCPVQVTTLDSSAFSFVVVFSAILSLAAAGTVIDICKCCIKSSQSNKQQFPQTIQEDGDFSSETDNGTRAPSGLSDSQVALVFSEHSDQPKDTLLVRFLLCFSLYTNGAKIMKTEGTQAQLGCLHGIRFLSMSWVILGHTYGISSMAIDNVLDMLEDIKGWAFEAVLQGPYAVDTFFTLSGLLMCYLFMMELKKRNGIMTWKNWVYFYVHRYWRLSAMYFMLLWFWISVFGYLGSGPLWGGTEGMDSKFCKKDVWKNILYINNFQSSNEQCMAWSWYLANDMQFYIISPLFLIPLYWYPKIGYVIVSVLLLACWITTGVINKIGGYTDLFGQFMDDTNTNPQAAEHNYMDDIYTKPYTRIGPYLVGALTGYLLFKIDKRKDFLTWWQALIGWLVAAFLGLSVVYGTYKVQMTVDGWSFYTAMSRSAWGLAVCWVIFACITGYGGWVNTFLSHPFWIPLSRLTYSAYLIHLILLIWYLTTLQKLIHGTHTVVVVCFLGLLVITYACSFLVSLLLEAPARNLEGLITKKQK